MDAYGSQSFGVMFGHDDAAGGIPDNLGSSGAFEGAFGCSSRDLAAGSAGAHEEMVGKKTMAAPMSTDAGDLLEGRDVDATRSYQVPLHADCDKLTVTA